MCRDELQVRTWYESTDAVNEYGEECVRIRGVYDKEVGDCTPIITRLTQWKIIAKRPQAEGFEVKGASAPSRSSVINCTPEAGPDPAERPPVDLTRPLTRRERRQLTDRLRQREAVKRRTFNHANAKNGTGIARTIDEIQLLTGETLSRGQALSLMSGAKMCINGKWCRGSGSGEIFAARMLKTALSEAQYKARAERVLAKFNAIRSVG